MDLLAAEIIEGFYTLLPPMTRISAFLLAAPLFSLQAVTVRIRVLIALALTIMIHPLIEWPAIDPISAVGLKEIVAQIFIGVLMGLILQVVQNALVVGGQAISASMGLSMANMVDPNMGNVPVIAQFLLICSTLIFLGFGGHMLVITALLESFITLPIGAELDMQSLMVLLIDWSKWLFLGALLVAIPIMVSLLFINLGIGVITRAAPALNIFAVGFPAMIMAGMLIVAMSMPSIGYQIQALWQSAFDTIGTMVGIV